MGVYSSSAGGSGSAGGGIGEFTQAMGDADQTVSTANASNNAVIKTTGALTSDRTLTMPAPATAGAAYTRVFRNTCTGSNLIVSIGSGTTVTVSPGDVVTLALDTAGVFNTVTGV